MLVRHDARGRVGAVIVDGSVRKQHQHEVEEQTRTGGACTGCSAGTRCTAGSHNARSERKARARSSSGRRPGA